MVADGHTLLHHPHTQSEVDIKKNVFTMMMRLPRLYRIPVHTVHKFGHLITGMSVRVADVVRITGKVGVRNSTEAGATQRHTCSDLPVYGCCSSPS